MKILLAGEGGQGIQLAAEILAKSAFLEGKSASLIPNFGVEQRGGVSLAFVIINKGALYPKFEQAEVMAIFCQRAQLRVNQYIGPKTKIIYGPSVKGGAKSNLPPKVWNMLILGKIIDLTKIVKKETVRSVLEKRLSRQFRANPNLHKMNMEALK